MHFGFSLLILSILLIIFSSELITNLKVGESFKDDRFQIIFKDLKSRKKKIIYLLGGTFLSEKWY